MTRTEGKRLTKLFFYQGPYVPSGVVYGENEWPSRSHWLVPGFDYDSLQIDIYCKTGASE